MERNLKPKSSEMSTNELLRALDTAREDMEVYELERMLEIDTIHKDEKFT